MRGRRSRLIAASLLVLVGVPLLAAPVALNIVSVVVLTARTADLTRVDPVLAIGRTLAWGPFGARFANAAAALAHRRGDADTELAYLTEAAAASPTDADLAAR